MIDWLSYQGEVRLVASNTGATIFSTSHILPPDFIWRLIVLHDDHLRCNSSSLSCLWLSLFLYMAVSAVYSCFSVIQLFQHHTTVSTSYGCFSIIRFFQNNMNVLASHGCFSNVAIVFRNIWPPHFQSSFAIITNRFCTPVFRENLISVNYLQKYIFKSILFL